MRYFIVFYFWVNDEYQGYGEIVMKDPGFPTRKRIMADIERTGKSNIKAITSIYEFKNKEDCDKYRGKEKT